MLHLAMSSVLRPDPVLRTALLDHLAVAICRLFQL